MALESAETAYFGQSGVCGVDPVCLDVDDISAFGPETITIQAVGTGVYRYYVNNFSQQFAGDTVPLSRSNAIVEVYQGAGSAPIRTFSAPQLPGTMWFVFELSGSTITTINTMVSFTGVQPARVASPFSAEARAEADLSFMRETLRHVRKAAAAERRDDLQPQ